MTYSRRDVWALDDQDTTLADYAKGVAAMQSRGPDDPTGWSFQAAMHGSHQRPGAWPFNQCKHFSWWFLPWHRMYVWYFEQIVRAAVVAAGGSAEWALPYWNYGSGGQDATLPLAFRNPQLADTANPLYVAARATGMNEGTGSIPPQIGYPAQALACPSFVGSYQVPPPEFGGSPADPSLQFATVMGVVENTPHNQVHNLVGGPRGWMTDPDTAAQDPIFWLHHSNIDRIWDEWVHTAVSHQDPNDPGWLSHPFKFFDAQGNQVSLTCAEVRDIVAQLDYQYVLPAAPGPPAPGPPAPPAPTAEVVASMASDSEPPPAAESPELVGASEKPVELSGTPVDVPISIDQRAARTALAGSQQPSHVYLTIQEVQGERDPGTVYGIYVNLPAEQASPDVIGAHYAGAISFFGIARAAAPRADEPPHSVSVSHDITDLTHQLASQNEWDGEHVVVSFRPTGLVPPDRPELAHVLPAGLSGDDPPITIGRVSIFYG